MMLNCRTKSYSGDILCKRIKQSDWQRKFWAKLKTQTVKLIEVTKSICYFFGRLSIYKKTVLGQLVFTYWGFNIANYFWRAHVGLATLA